MLCSKLGSFLRHQCVHGIGHGLMAWTSYELLDALPLCDGLQEERNQLSCYSGIFMENVVGGLAGTMGHTTEYLSDDPHFPCNILAQRYVAPCYFYQTSRAVALFGYDFARTAQFCREAPSSAHRECFLSLGRDIGLVSRGEPAKAIELCGNATGADNRQACLEGAVQDRFWQPAGADEALTFCRMLVRKNEKDACYWTITFRAKELYEDASSLRGFCAEVEEPYRKWCE